MPDIGLYYPDGRCVQSQALSLIYMTQNQGSISLNHHGQQVGECPPLGNYRCKIPEGRDTPQNLYIRIGEVIKFSTSALAT